MNDPFRIVTAHTLACVWGVGDDCPAHDAALAEELRGHGMHAAAALVTEGRRDLAPVIARDLWAAQGPFANDTRDRVIAWGAMPALPFALPART